jgi:hypothetical protein
MVVVKDQEVSAISAFKHLFCGTLTLPGQFDVDTGFGQEAIVEIVDRMNEITALG